MKAKPWAIHYRTMLFGIVCLILGALVGALFIANTSIVAFLVGAFADQPVQNRASSIAALAQLLQVYFFFLLFAAGLVAVSYHFRQLREMKEAREFEVSVRMDEWIHSPEAEAERRFVIHALPSSPDSEALRDRARTMWERLQRVARWANQRNQSLVDVESMMDKDGEIFVKSWDLLEPYIEEARKEREGKSDKYYYQKDFQEFAYRCAVFLKNNHHHIFEKIRAESRAPSRWLEKIAEEDEGGREKAEG